MRDGSRLKYVSISMGPSKNLPTIFRVSFVGVLKTQLSKNAIVNTVTVQDVPLISSLLIVSRLTAVNNCDR